MQKTHLVGARTHNLRSVSVDLAEGEFVCLTGVSGSGKSSLAVDTLYAEGQRRFVESFSPYARQFLERLERPPMDELEPVAAGIAVDRRAPVKSSRSTVATMAAAPIKMRKSQRFMSPRLGQRDTLVKGQDIRLSCKYEKGGRKNQKEPGRTMRGPSSNWLMLPSAVLLLTASQALAHIVLSQTSFESGSNYAAFFKVALPPSIRSPAAV